MWSSLGKFPSRGKLPMERLPVSLIRETSEQLVFEADESCTDGEQGIEELLNFKYLKYESHLYL